MERSEHMTQRRADFEPFTRNRFYYGKLMDVHQFDLETHYANHKRWMINHLVFGSGVVCGLNVLPGKCPDQVIVSAGVAFDKRGREVVVPSAQTLVLPPEVMQRAHDQCGERQTPCVRIELCYHECPGDPEPVYAGDCSCAPPCEAGTIRERFCLEVKEGGAPPVHIKCRMSQVVADGMINYPALVQWLAGKGCPTVAPDPCIVLANVHLSGGEKGHSCRQEDIDIAVRHIVFTNRLLAELLPCILEWESGADSD